MAPDTKNGFIGRKRELEVLRVAMDRAKSGQPNIALLAGEPGIGKTSTALEISRQAAQCDVLALWGRCSEELGAPPYWPWIQLIRRFVAIQDEAALAEIVGTAGEQLGTLDPGLLIRLMDKPSTPGGTDEAKARFHLFDTIAGFWRRASIRQPLLLVIDDLHQADVPSLRLLEFVLAEAGSSRLMILGTYRDAVVVRQHPLTDTLAELNRNASVQRLLLGGFSQEETAQFVASSIGDTSSELASMLHDQTEGHPLFLAELARDFLQANGKNAAMAWSNMARRSKGIRGVIGARLNRLAPASLYVLQGAAVFGREFRLDLLCASFDGLSEDDCRAALHEATTACLIAEGGETGHYQFVHALVRDTLYDELPAARRTQLHLQIGAAFERQYRNDLAPCLSALAHHYHAAGPAGDSAKAVEYATRAARRATEMLAHEEASRHYLRACSALPQGSAADSRRGQLLLALGDSQNCAGASALALTTFAEAAEYARQLGDAALLAHAAVGFGDAQWRLGIEGSPAVSLISEALLQGSAADLRGRTSLLTALCRALLFSNRPDEAEDAFRDAMACARSLDDPLILFRAMCAILPGRWFPDRLSLRIDTARQAIEQAGRVGHPEWVAPYLSGWHTGDLMEAGDTAGAKATAQFHLMTGETRHEPFNEAVALAALAMVATHEGRFAEGEALATKALRCGARFDRSNAAGIFGVQMFTLWRHQGRLPELMPMFQQFVDGKPQRAMWRPGLALLYCELGSPDQAREILESYAADGFSGIERDAIRIASVAYLAEVCVWLGEKEHAPVLFDILLPYAGRNIVFGAHTASFGAADRLLGMLAVLMEHPDLAVRHFEAAIVFDERSGGWPWLARSRFELGRMLLRRGTAESCERAASLLKAALEEARQLGMRALETSVQEVLRQTAKSRAPRAGVAGLSEREVQVLALMAAGKTNQQIAAELFRSPNTVANHVRNILGKTQAANRAEASAFAVRHGLSPTE